MSVQNAHPALIAGGAPAPPARLTAWLQLMVGIFLILLFVFGGGRLAQFIPGARHMAEVIDEHDLRATAIFYTDFKESADGAWHVRHSLDFRPGGGPESTPAAAEGPR